MTTQMTRDQLVAAMEEFSKQALVKLQSYKQVEQEYKATVKALQALRGTNGHIKTGKVGKAGKRTSKGSGGKPGPTSMAVFAILQAHPKGLDSARIREELRKAGRTINRHTVHNSLRHVKAVATGQVVIGKNGHERKVYRLP